MSHPTLTPQPQSIAALWPVLTFRPAQDRRLSWPACWLNSEAHDMSPLHETQPNLIIIITITTTMFMVLSS